MNITEILACYDISFFYSLLLLFLILLFFFPVLVCRQGSVNGHMTCPRCHKSFTRPRPFNSHRCMAEGDYIDLSHWTMKREAVSDDEAGSGATDDGDVGLVGDSW